MSMGVTNERGEMYLKLASASVSMIMDDDDDDDDDYYYYEDDDSMSMSMNLTNSAEFKTVLRRSRLLRPCVL